MAIWVKSGVCAVCVLLTSEDITKCSTFQTRYTIGTSDQLHAICLTQQCPQTELLTYRLSTSNVQQGAEFQQFFVCNSIF